MSEDTWERDVAINYKVWVYRVLHDEEPDQTALKVERHRARGAAVKAAFKDSEELKVLDWGDVDSEEPHELVEILVAVATSPAVQGAAVTAVTWLGAKLADHAVDAAISAGLKSLARKVFRMQRDEKRVSDVLIWPARDDRPGVGSPQVQLFPPEWNGKTVASIWFDDGSRVEFHPPLGGWTGDPELDPAAERIPEPTAGPPGEQNLS